LKRYEEELWRLIIFSPSYIKKERRSILYSVTLHLRRFHILAVEEFTSFPNIFFTLELYSESVHHL